MTDLRVYIPVTPARLRELAASGELPAGPVAGFAVGEAIRAAYGEDDDELWEFGAQQEAAASAAEAGHVLVLAVDVPAASVTTPDRESAQVAVAGPVTSRNVNAILVGDDVITGATVTVGEEEIELSWYDPSELTLVLALLG